MTNTVISSFSNSNYSNLAKSLDKSATSTREKILQILESQRDECVSGEFIAQQLGVSRMTISKTIKLLQQQGYKIEVAKNKGYILNSINDVISSYGIKRFLNPTQQNLPILVYEKLTSTNSVLKERANLLDSDCLMIAIEQTHGKGRRGRNFFSPKDTGIYMSLLLKPCHFQASEAWKLTIMSVLSMCKAIELILGQPTDIKWVNDIFIQGKKVGGILTEASFDVENGAIQWVVIGIGVNIYQPTQGFPRDITRSASSVLTDPQIQQDNLRNQLIATFLNYFYAMYHNPNDNHFIEEYKERCFIIGSKVNLLVSQTSEEVLVLAIDENCRLITQNSAGDIKAYACGEVSLKVE